MKIKTLVIFIFISCFSSIAFAHAGHDHNSPFALLSHLLWIAPVMILAAVIYSKNLKKTYQMKSSKQQSSKEGKQDAI